MRSRGRDLGNRQCADLAKFHRAIAREALVLRRDLPGLAETVR
jgi:hypothetical protein